METRTLIRVLEKSAEKNGENTTLTIGHLLGILKFAQELDDRSSEEEFKRLQSAEQEWFESTL